MASGDDFAEQERTRRRARKKRRKQQFRAQLSDWCKAANVSEERLADPRHFLENAKTLSQHVSPPEDSCDYLYSRLGRPPSSRSEWEKGIRQCIAVRTMVTSGLFSDPDLANLIDPAAADEAASSISSAKGTLVVANHGGFEPLLWITFRKLFKNGTLITAAPDHGTGAYSAVRDPAMALFAGRRALLDRQQLFMAPDGIVKKTAGMFDSKRKTRSLQILGLDWPASDGAPFVAYDTSSETAWFTVIVRDRGFTPMIIKGPCRQPDDSLSAFRDRFWRFYAQQIENSLAGDPRDVPIGRVTLLLMKEAAPAPNA